MKIRKARQFVFTAELLFLILIPNSVGFAHPPTTCSEFFRQESRKDIGRSLGLGLAIIGVAGPSLWGGHLAHLNSKAAKVLKQASIFDLHQASERKIRKAKAYLDSFFQHLPYGSPISSEADFQEVVHFLALLDSQGLSSGICQPEIAGVYQPALEYPIYPGWLLNGCLSFYKQKYLPKLENFSLLH